VTALGATAAEDCCTSLGLHAREEAVGLGAVAAVGLKGTLRHDKNSCGRRRLLLKLLAIAAISEYTLWDGFFTGLTEHTSFVRCHEDEEQCTHKADAEAKTMFCMDVGVDGHLIASQEKMSTKKQSQNIVPDITRCSD
jgi:hypothetical protein